MDYSYDVFISYSWCDNQNAPGGGWVEEFEKRLKKQLIAHLNNPKVWRDANKIGGNHVLDTTIEQALESSAILLAIISENYKKSVYVKKELNSFIKRGDLIANPSTGNDQHRIFCVYLSEMEECDRPEQLQELLGFQFHEEGFPLFPNHEKYGEKLEELAKSIAQTLNAIEEETDLQPSSPAQPDMLVILRAMKGIGDKIELLYGLKKLHDELHNIQIDFYNPTKNLRFEDDQSIGDDELLDLEDAEQTFKNCVELLWKASAGVQELKPEERWSAQLDSWIKSLDESHALFKEGMVERDLQKIQKSLKEVSRVMAQEPTKINTRLSSVASSLELTGVITTLRSATPLLDQGGGGAETLNQIQRNIEKLEQLHVEIKELIAKHDAWQELDDQLRRIVPLGYNFDLLLDELKASWVDLQSSVIYLFPAEAEEPMPSSIREFFDLLKGNEEDVDPDKLQRDFIKFLKVAGQRFNQADKKLRQGFDDARNLASTLQENIRERVER